MDSPLRPSIDPFTAAINGTPEGVMSPSWTESPDNSRDDSCLGAADWVVALCSITFDLDVGQQVDECYPPGSLSEEEQTDIAFHAFPDSMSMELHSKSSIRDSLFFFRVRRRGHAAGDDAGRGSQSPAGRARGHRHPCLYGYVFCRQRQDSSLKRGGDQRSVVIVSEQPYSSVLRPLSQIAGPLYFSYGLDALTQVYSDICIWPSPRAGVLLQLPVGGLNTISAMLPAPALLPPPACEPEGLDPVATRALGLAPVAADALLDEAEMDASSPSADGSLAQPSLALSVFGDLDVYTPLQGLLPKLWTLWEIALVGEPLIVVAPSPAESSAAVAAVVSLISPLPFAGDFRPYYTIHDPEFSCLGSSGPPEPRSPLPRLIGITNLYILKVLYPSWQNVLAVGSKPPPAKPNGAASGAAAYAWPAADQDGLVGSAVRALKRRQQGPLQLMADHRETLWSAYKPLSRPDQSLLARLRQVPRGCETGQASRLAMAHSAAIRRHFEALTSALLAPFTRYVVPQMPPARGPLPACGPRQLPDFDARRWLDSELAQAVASCDSTLLERFGGTKALSEIYRRLLEGSNFQSWMARRQAAARAWQARTWELAAAARKCNALEYMDEVTMVQTFYSLERKLEEAGPAGLSSHATEALKMQLCSLFAAMPMDLQQTLLSSPARSLLIQGLLLSRSEDGS